MSEVLSQQEIDALLKNTRANIQNPPSLAPEEADALGEIGNISMGTAATTLSSLLNQRVLITTPNVSIIEKDDLEKEYSQSYVAVDIQYTEGLEGRNLLIVHDRDVKIITDLLMGGDGSNIDGDLSEIHMSAIGEVMNQMIGSSATSLASMFQKSINISPPRPFVMDVTELNDRLFCSEDALVKVLFSFKIGEIINSEMMQLLPIDFAKTLVRNLLNSTDSISEASDSDMKNCSNEFDKNMENQSESLYAEAVRQRENQRTAKPASFVNVQPVTFENFDEEEPGVKGKENIDIILDVPLQVTVEVGKTKKAIRDILEFSSGVVIELDKQAGDPLDILVNGKLIARGEVVVIDENFGIRITEMVQPLKNIPKV